MFYIARVPSISWEQNSLIFTWWKFNIPGSSFWPMCWVQFLACGEKVLFGQWGSSEKGEARKSDHRTNKIPWFPPDLRDFSQIPWLFPDWKMGKSFSSFPLISSLAGNPDRTFPVSDTAQSTYNYYTGFSNGIALAAAGFSEQNFFNSPKCPQSIDSWVVNRMSLYHWSVMQNCTSLILPEK